MIPRLHRYKKIVGQETVDRIRECAQPLVGKHVVHVNSSSTGGGVAEILNTMVFLMDDLGMRTGWRVIIGSKSFFKITKGIHNGLQGSAFPITASRKKIYLEYCERNALITHIKDHDINVIHDPQPLGMITHYTKKTTWLWRCHIDISAPNPSVMNFLLPYIRRYDGMIISSPKYRINRLKVPQSIMMPSIDPLSDKNKDISMQKAERLLSRHGIDTGKPIITQISRFDRWKDPLGVVRMYKLIREKHDCQLVLMGDMAADDPEGPIIFQKVKQMSEDIDGIHTITERNDLLVNALQKMSAMVMQNSKREGFGLTVSEAMWKGTPVFGGNVGGIPMQIIDGRTGYIIRSERDTAKKAIRLLEDPRLGEKIGLEAREHVRKNFLITRHLQDYVDIFNKHVRK